MKLLRWRSRRALSCLAPLLGPCSVGGRKWPPFQAPDQGFWVLSGGSLLGVFRSVQGGYLQTSTLEDSEGRFTLPRNISGGGVPARYRFDPE